MLIEILSIGNEVLQGKTVNTNAAFLSKALADKGYDVARQSVLPDDSEKLIAGMQEALSRSTLVVATGGLGPTLDDLTKQCAAKLFCTPLVKNSALYDELKERFGVLPSLDQQSLVPKDAILLSNFIGTAPGFLFLSSEGSLLLLPGAPKEMQAMFLEVAIPLLAKHFPVRARFQTKEILLCLVKELELDPLLRHIQEKNPDAKIGIYPSLGMLSLRFQVSYRFERLELWESMVLKEFSSYVVQAQSLEVSVHQKLIETKKTLALAESCTGGLITSRLVALSGASEYLLGSMVVYSNAWKEQFLGVNAATIKKFGAVSKETAIEMVQGLLGLTAADYALAATGVAGPTGGTAAHPVGTIFIALAERGGAIDAGYIHAPLDRASALELTVQTALGVLWRKLAYTVATFS